MGGLAGAFGLLAYAVLAVYDRAFGRREMQVEPDAIGNP